MALLRTSVKLPKSALANVLAIGATVADSSESQMIDVVLPVGHHLDGGPVPGFMVIRRDVGQVCLFSMPINDFTRPV